MLMIAVNVNSWITCEHKRLRHGGHVCHLDQVRARFLHHTSCSGDSIWDCSGWPKASLSNRKKTRRRQDPPRKRVNYCCSGMPWPSWLSVTISLSALICLKRKNKLRLTFGFLLLFLRASLNFNCVIEYYWEWLLCLSYKNEASQLSEINCLYF